MYGLPTKRGAARVNLWRQLKKCGALPFKTSAYLLPDRPPQNERLQWLAQQVRDSGGEATIIRVTEIEGLRNEDLVRQFNQARAADYGALLSALNQLLSRNRKRPGDSFAADLERLARQFEEVRTIDFFDCPKAQDAQMSLKRAASWRVARSKTAPPLAIKKFTGKTWLTRPRPEIDRVGSAWLIRKFLDAKARFIFGTDPARHPGAIPYDMLDVEFTHHDDDCTFETLVKRFGIADKAVSKIAEMVHDADLEDGKFQRVECVGIDQVLKGWAKSGWNDEELLARGVECFDALYLYLSKRG
ncbi:MAG: chromate resistance protein [Verrucomicrobia bacterium]|nr:chromate resistance protein [Verrucomicrobiota bacterium]